ncbi:hypothetical protein OHB26_15105 [Nocardia sp. NBC_01503]|uniref:hypothetical protein n=1 Tax=Nocardia sp. NBC_01503 TaxID=2975997 RepID=UPI002E7BD988|nr:hypothetical protein [Nocardia sp. NBC_01503]WTL35402.1 hypothetical protein OHB26_15105 [Nocardia sp. NBC_01503]
MAKHRRQTTTQRMAARAAMGVVPLVAVVAGSATAQAASEQAVAQPQFITPQPGVTTPNPGNQSPGPIQPGVTKPPAPAAVKTPPPSDYVSPADDAHGVAPASDYNAPYRQVPQREYIAPLQPETLHAPEPAPQLAEIVPDPKVLRAGDLSMAAPDFLNTDQIDQINSTFARPEADISQYARSLGVAPSRADSVAASAIAGAVQGAVIGCGIGATLQIVTVIAFPLTPLTCLTWGATGGIAGAVIGAGMGGLR